MQKKRRGLKITAIVVLVIVALILVLPIIFKSYIKNHLVEIYNRSQNDYHLVVGNVNLSGFTSGMLLSDVELVNTNPSTQSALASLKAKFISIEDVSVFKLIYNKCLVAGKLEINSPSIIMNRVKENTGPEKEKDKADKNAVNISEIKITDPHFAYFLNKDDSLPLFKTDKGSILIREFAIDTIKDSKEFSAYDITAKLQGIKYLTEDSLYTILVSQLQVSYSKRSLQIDSFQVMPNHSKKMFGVKAGKQTDRISLAIPHISSTTFDAKAFVERQVVRADSIEVDNFSLNAYRDKNIADKVFYPKPIQELLKRVDIPISVHHLNVLNGDVLYEELSPGSKYAGHISFRNVRSHIDNISNSTTDDTLMVRAKATFGEKANFEVGLDFPLVKDDNSFFCHGKLGPFPASTLNTMVPFVAGVSVEAGYINYLKFNFHATMVSSSGFVDMNYKDLKVAVVSMIDGKSQSTGKKIVSVLANAFIVKSDVPSKSNSNTKARIFLKKDPERFIFNYSWKSIFSGVKEVVTGKAVSK